MKKQLLISTLFTGLLSIMSFAQNTSNLVIFSEGGEKFILNIDGVAQNSEPATNVKATGLTGDFHQISVQFADKSLGMVNQNIMLEAGLELKAVVMMKKKGGYALRPFGEPVAISNAPEAPQAPAPPVYVNDPGTPATTQTTTVAAPVSTTVTTTSTTNTGTGEHFNMNVGIGETKMDVNIQINDGMGGMGTSTTVHTTETVTHSSNTTAPVKAAPVQAAPEPVAAEVVHTCGPMAGGDFGSAKKSIDSKSFEDSKMTTAKQILKGNCMSTDQIIEMMGLFTYEESKIDFAKAAHDKCSDPQNYWKLNDAFTFSSSIDDLNEYLESK